MLGAVGMDMSGGDIWSTGAFSFESPLKDLLDSGNYTLEQLLNEDELLQELRGCHVELISYFSSELSVTKLVQYVIQQQGPEVQVPPPYDADAEDTTTTTTASAGGTTEPRAVTPDESSSHESNPEDNGGGGGGEGPQMNGVANDNRTKPGEWLLRHLQDVQQTVPPSMDDVTTEQQQQQSKTNDPYHHERQMIRFPYMACEIICCEIPSVIDTLVDGKCVFRQPTPPTTETTTTTTTNNTGSSMNILMHSNATNDEVSLPLRGQSLIDEQLFNDDDDEEEELEIRTERSAPTTTTTDVTEIVTSDSQGDIVEVVAKPESTLDTCVTSSEQQEQEQPALPHQTLSILDLLFSLLYTTPIGQLDDYRAGYFDKILSILFRKRPDELTNYINGGGIYGRTVLIQSMLNHLYSHSIMQIAQRLLLPPRPIGEPQQIPQQQQGDDDQQEPDDIISNTENEATLQQEHHLQLQNMNGNNNENGAEIVAGDDGDDPEAVGVRCDWGNSPEVLEMLLDTLIGPQPRSLAASTNDNKNDDDEKEESRILDLSLNASEVLITIIQNSMLSSTTMLTLTSYDVIARIVDAATTLRHSDYFSPHESVLTSAMNVLESLVLQLGGYGAVGTMTFLPEDELISQQQLQQQQQQQQNDDNGVKVNENEAIYEADAPHTMTDQIQEVESDDTLNTGQEVGLVDNQLISDLGAMLDHLPKLLDQLSILLRHPSTVSWTSPTQFSKLKPIQLLGNSRLRIVRVLESLVLLGDPDVDAILVQSNCLEICLDFFWEFQWCSMLHQSVANLLVHVFEGQNTRYEMQKYFLVKCNLLGRLMESFKDDKSTHDAANAAVPTPSDFVDDGQATSELAIETVSPLTGDDEKSPDSPLHISEDDVDAAIDAQKDEKVNSADAQISDENNAKTASTTSSIVDVLSTSDVIQTNTSTVVETNLSPPAQALRCGYMGHVIIICQALVHAYTNNPHDQDMMQEDGEGLENDQMRNMNENNYDDMEQGISHLRHHNKDDVDATEILTRVDNEETEDEDETAGPKDIYGDPLLLFEIVHTHQLAEKWHDFVDSTLAAETAIQSTPLGGLSMQQSGMDMLHSHRPGLADEGYMMGDDGEGPPVPPRGMLGGGDMIHMDEHDLDIAATLMQAGLSLGRPNAPDIDEDHSNNSADSEKSYNSGETARDKVGYAFDDPLGKAGGLGIELDKLTKLSTGDAIATSYSGDDDDGSHSSDEGEIETLRSGSGDVPIIDLFAGNFNYDQSSDKESTLVPTEEFANFAAFDATETVEVGVFAGVVDAAKNGNAVVEHNTVESSDLDDLFGKGDHAQLLELDDLPMEETLSPIKPIREARAHDTNQDFYDNVVTAEDNLKADLFDAKQDYSAIAQQPSEVDDSVDDDIQTAPSDELMADSIEPVSEDTVTEDIGQL